MSEPCVRPAAVEDAAAIAVVHHTAWVQTYSHLLPATHWESDTVERRRQAWHDQLSTPDVGHPMVAVVDEQVVGFARAGGVRVKDGISPVRTDELWALYVRSENHGTGVGAQLLDAVLPPARPAELWVVEVNARARGFYEKQGFTPDGARFIDGLGIAEIRMVR